MSRSSQQPVDSTLNVQMLLDEVSGLRVETCELKAALDQERRRNAHYQEEIAQQIEQLRAFKREVFGKRSERWVPVEQTPLFNEAEVLAGQPEAGDEIPEEDKVEVKGFTRVRGKRKPLPENLPREIVIIDIPEHEKTDAQGQPLVRLVGKEISEQLEYTPATIKVIETHRLKYESLNSEGESVIKTAPHPPQLLPKTMATSSLVAAITTHKYADGLPLYRMEEIFKRSGVDLSRQTMARWVVSVGGLCQPIWNILEERLMGAPYVSVDETWTQVLKEKGRPAESKSWMWVRANPGCDKKILLFDYDASRSGDVAKKLFEDFTGYLQADGYGGYNFTEKTSGITRIGCNMHGRRYFEKAKVTGLKQGRALAEQGLSFYKALYAIEERAGSLSFDERFEMRLAEAVPIWDEMKLWAEGEIRKVPPKGKIGRAFHYFLEQYDFLRGYLRDGRLEIDNGFVERAIRKFAIGRNNWMFSDTIEGAQASSLLYSFVITAKVNGVDPFRALKRIFEELPRATTCEDFERLADYLLIPALAQT